MCGSRPGDQGGCRGWKVRATAVSTSVLGSARNGGRLRKAYFTRRARSSLRPTWPPASGGSAAGRPLSPGRRASACANAPPWLWPAGDRRARADCSTPPRTTAWPARSTPGAAPLGAGDSPSPGQRVVSPGRGVPGGAGNTAAFASKERCARVLASWCVPSMVAQCLYVVWCLTLVGVFGRDLNGIRD